MDAVIDERHRDTMLAELSAMARELDESGKSDRAQVLLDARWFLRTQGDATARDDVALEELHHRMRTDRLRFAVASLLILSLFAVVTIGLMQGVEGDAVSQLAAPLSGLAGIAVGWIFGGNRQP